MDDDMDIYADLPNFNIGDDENLSEKNKKITEKCANLEKQVTELTQSLESLKKINTNLEVNLSSLLQTAKAEIARKDRMIAEIREQLDNMKFCRGEYSRSAKPPHHRPPRRKRESSPEERNCIAKKSEVPVRPDLTEFVCGNPPPSIKDNVSTNSNSHHLNGIVSTVFGERLRKRILEEQEEARKQMEQSKAKTEINVKKTPESIRPDQSAKSNLQSGTKPDSLKLDHKASSEGNKGLSLGSNSSVREDGDFLKWNHSDRKRQSEDQIELARSCKNSKGNDEKPTCHNSNRYNNEEICSAPKNSSKSKPDERLCTKTDAPVHLDKNHMVDEHRSLVESDVQNKKENIDTVEDIDQHNRVAIRLMLLAEGIDPDIESRKSAKNEQKKYFEDKKQSRKRSRETSRSRSKSKNRRNNHRSQSSTKEEYSKSRRPSGQREDWYRRGRDRFEKLRNSKNKDGDNLSEFSREICELKKRIDYKVNDRSSDRDVKNRNSNRHRRNDERNYKRGRSRTPDSSRSGSKEKTVYRSREDKQYERSRSHERHKSRNRGKHFSNFDDISTQHAETVRSERIRIENLEITPVETSTLVIQNSETKSLVSLEDGEIIDSADSSPVKMVDATQSFIEQTLSSTCKLNFLNSDELASKIDDVKCSLPLREIGNSQNIEKSLPIEKPVLCIPDSNRFDGVNNSLNSSQDERIENIAKFIANFGTDISENKKDEKSNNKIIHHDVSDVKQPNYVAFDGQVLNEKIPCILHTEFQNSPTNSPLLSPFMATSNEISPKNANGNNADDDWCLIAIDSPIKNFEENRKSRMMAQILLMNEKPPKADDLMIKYSNESSEGTCVDESCGKIKSEGKKVVFEEIVKSLAQPIKNTSKSKPPVLRSLRSTYHKGRKEMILSDTNSEQCTKISIPHPVNLTTESLSCDLKSIQRNRDDVNELVESGNSGKCRFNNPALEEVDYTSKKSENGEEKQGMDDLHSNQTDYLDIVEDKETVANDQSDIVENKEIVVSMIVRCVDEGIKKNKKSKTHNSRTNKETTTKVGGNIKSEISDNKFKGFNSQETTACKTDLSDMSKTDIAKPIESKNNTGYKEEKSDQYSKTCISKGSENGMKSTKTISKAKVQESISKQKKDRQKLIVFARRRKPVHLEDSSTSSSIVTNLSSFSENINNSGKSTTNDTTL